MFVITDEVKNTYENILREVVLNFNPLSALFQIETLIACFVAFNK